MRKVFIQVCIFSVLIILLLLCACTQRKETSSFDSNTKSEVIQSPLLPLSDWDAYFHRNGSHLTFTLTNHMEETITVFHYGPYHTEAVICQKKECDIWKTIKPDDGPVATYLFDDKMVYINPGETKSVTADLSKWSWSIQKNDAVRILVGVWSGENTYANVLYDKIKPEGYLCFELK